ncbi:hypothetical protein Tsubulata_016385 [Turnera subulata]|uniref:Protein kinase domain-containing protein n=1 Tax=Turnera subulata TaxID=218843 RepID=A0A9Q0F175_9ROSI|nr:hypothetical protein Tsubulata_016385 [Turnera subulata]
MLSRAFTKPKKSPKNGDQSDGGGSKSGFILESEDCMVGFMDDLPVIVCGQGESRVGLREILRSSVGVMGESPLGMTEKVVLLQGKVYALKRFRRTIVRRKEFARRVERLAMVSGRCEYLVPVTAYLYTKRIKFVVCDYHPMGSLADLLAGEREFGHTALVWNQRLIIALSIAQAISFIHTRCPPYDKKMQMNVHGNIKASNVMININFTACLSDYGFTQLAEFEKVSDTGQRKPASNAKTDYCNELNQKSDIFNFGVILLDMLGGSEAPGLRDCIEASKEIIKEGNIEFFEFPVEGHERKQALQVLDIALACTSKVPVARPSIEKILRALGDVIIK